ncbi:uncharacterized protein LY89DRAFT_739931 [Mollisia scopiformis]|uniref:Uncharacterized protein n=1 Tax=Mollisia scopiformis TaxID=149040 RepID=A0A194WSM3_MOLSC|nr:uncharacterized protein LY89DRAFT_739931 [Mollisia scopiformis]KUJ10958.1 hypothetical protein LY89DRAFT_739931 [Mollisia scopiformis]
MGVPFSQEVKTAVDLASDLATDLRSHATVVLYAVVIVSVIHTVLLSLFLLAVIGLIVSVNPDLAEERKAFVTPAVRWILFPLRGWKAVFAGTAGRERPRGQEFENESRSSNESARGQRRRKMFSGGGE